MRATAITYSLRRCSDQSVSLCAIHREARERPHPLVKRPTETRRSAMRLIRHYILFAIAAATFAAEAHAQEPARVKFTLDWLIDGQQAPFFLAQAKGYFTHQGV